MKTNCFLCQTLKSTYDELDKTTNQPIREICPPVDLGDSFNYLTENIRVMLRVVPS